MLKKIFITLITIMLVLGMCGSVNATELKTTLDIVQQASETKYLENDQGYISKTVVDSNSETGEVTIELKLSNTKKEEQKVEATEIFIVMDDSGSMEGKNENGIRRKTQMVDATIKLVQKIFNNINNCSIGLIKFSGPSSVNETGNLNNAVLLNKASSNEQDIINILNRFKNQIAVNGTNIESGIQLAKNNFDKNCNKIIILITDGLPDSDLHGNTIYNNNVEGMKKVDNNTRQCLIDEEINIISLLTGIDESSDESSVENEQRINEIYGTHNNPTADKFYKISDSNIEKIVTEDIYLNVMEIVQNPINTVKVEDYFPEDITENFEFSYVGTPNIGIVSSSINEETKSISWDIGTLKGDETATLRYKLKIKDMKNTELLNKTIATNEKVVLTYTDTDSKEYTVTLTSSPKIQLSEVKEELTATVTYDPTTDTTEKVTATIKTNKKVNKVEGWTLSEDGKTLTKEYTKNTTETVHLVDTDGMTKDVIVTISNIIVKEPDVSIEIKDPDAIEEDKAEDKKEDKKEDEGKEEDTTIANGKLPQTGVSMTIVFSLIGIVIVAIIVYKKYNSYKDIK